MSEEPHRGESADRQETADAPEARPPRKGRRRWRRARRFVVRLVAFVLAVVAGLVVAILTVDLGPLVRDLAERRGSQYIERPMRIGRLSAKLIPGTFVVDDLIIEGLEPAGRPFLTVRKITVQFPWWTVFSRRLNIESVTMTDWDMFVETFPPSADRPTGRHNFPRFTRPRTEPARPLPFTTTLKALLASRGSFTYEDHGTPWRTVARNLTVQMYRSDVTRDYRGRTTFSNGTVQIQNYLPFRTDMQSRFTLDGGKVHFDRIDLLSDGAKSIVTGDLNLARWPEQLYQVRSRIDFPTQKNIFFHDQGFTVSGEGDFEGTFHLFKGGRRLQGTFRSAVAGLNDWRFPGLRGSILWLPDRLEITDATSGLYGGSARFDFRMAPFGAPTRARAEWDVAYRDVDLARLTDFLETQGVRLAGRASGQNRLAWQLGRWAERRGGGEIVVEPPPGVQPMAPDVPADRLAALEEQPVEVGPFNPFLPLGYLPVAGRIAYAIDPEWIVLDESWAATERTVVTFSGRTAYGERSRIPFHVTSLDWQESDRVLAGILTMFGAPAAAVPIGGHGEFDGVMLGAFRQARIQGRFTGENLRAWGVVWGSGRADLVIENAYAFVADSVMTRGDSEIRANGQFSLGYPRRDGREEIDARVRISRRPLADLRHAFRLDDYPVEGVLSGEFHVYG
ncbi:MAG TPA: hypothetical protein VLD67_15605, partial [Vicinamibacterales bacterium]|nr:hypothetical protein [Vicinamibacterales bacterium]